MWAESYATHDSENLQRLSFFLFHNTHTAVSPGSDASMVSLDISLFLALPLFLRFLLIPQCLITTEFLIFRYIFNRYFKRAISHSISFQHCTITLQFNQVNVRSNLFISI